MGLTNRAGGPKGCGVKEGPDLNPFILKNPSSWVQVEERQRPVRRTQTPAKGEKGLHPNHSRSAGDGGMTHGRGEVNPTSLGPLGVRREGEGRSLVGTRYQIQPTTQH